MANKFIRATLLQLTGIIGAGIFALPYLFYHSNFYLGVAGLFFLTFIIGAIEYLYLDIILATPGDHQLSGYAAIYLNHRYKLLAALSVFLTGLAATLAYIKLGSGFLAILFPHLNPTTSILIFLGLTYFFHLFRFPIINSISFYLPLLFIFFPLLLLSLVIQIPLPPIDFQPVSLSFVGATIFALTGFTTLPEIEEILRGQRHKTRLLHSASVLGLILACLIYLIFSFAVIKLSGSRLSADAVSGLFIVAWPLGLVLAIFGFFTTFRATLNYLNIFKEVFYRDFAISPKHSYLLSLTIPLIAVFLRQVSFLQIISLAGTVTIFSSVIIICLIRTRLPTSRFHYFLIGAILAAFTVGLLFELLPL